MDAAAAERQLNQMRQFILLEAKEKADEIRTKAKADADLEKQTQVLSQKTKLAEDYDRKLKAQALELKIKASMEERKQRSRLLLARDQLIQKLGGEAKEKLSIVATSRPEAYSNLLKGLIKQGLLRLAGEAKVEVRCRPADLERVRAIAPGAAAEVTAELREAGEVRPIAISVKAEPAMGASAGGVILAAQDGKIRCNNTLEERLTLAMAELTPVVRDLLFPSARAEVRQKPMIHIHGKEAFYASGVSAPAGGAGAGAGAASAHAHAAPAARPAPAPAAAAPRPAAPAAGGAGGWGAAPAAAAADPFAGGAGAGAGAGGGADPFGF